MSNQEAFQFRLNALTEQSAFAMGAAAEQADTMYGSMTDLEGTIRDAAQSVGDFLGPVGEIGAYAADNAIQVALFSAGLVKLVQGAAAARTALIALTGAQTGLAALGTVFMGPVGIIAAVGLAGIAISQFADDAGVSFHQVSEDAIGSIDAVIAKVVELADTSALGQTILGLDTITASLNKQNQEFNDALSIIPGWIMTVQTLNDANEETIEGIDRETLAMDGLSNAVLDLIDTNADGILTAKELEAGLAAVEQQAEQTQNVINGLAQGSDELAQILALSGEGAADAKAEALAYTEALLTSGLAADTYEAGLRQVLTTYGDVQEAALESAAGTDEWTASTEKGAEAALELAHALGLSLTMAGRGPAGTEGMLSTFELWEEGLTETDLAALELADTLSTTLAQAGSGLMGTRGMLNEFELWESQLTGTEQAALDLADTLSSTLAAGGSGSMGLFGLDAILAEQEAEAIRVTIENLTGDLTRAFDAVAATYTNTTNALENGFRIIVGNTNAIADQAQGVADWADELIGAAGTYAVVDDLLSEHIITLDQYKAAQQAQISIAEDNALIQSYVNEIQAESAPIIAGLMDAQENYMESVARMGPEQQALALAYMDSATAMQALELAQIAASEAPGFEGLIQGAIAANPYIEAILTDMGIISRGTKGELVINTTGETEVESLTNAINALNTTFTTLLVIDVDDSQLQSVMNGGGSTPMSGAALRGESGGGMAFNVVMTADNSDVTAKISDSTDKLNTWASSEGTAKVLADNNDGLNKISLAGSKLNDWDASTGTANLNAADNASGVIASVNNALNAINGKTATTYVNTVYTTAGAALGGVMGYANGGITAEMGEWGTETLHFPNGGIAHTRGRGMYTVPQGTYVSPHNGTERTGGMTLNITVNGDIYDTEDLAVAISRHTVPAIQRAVAQHVRGF